MRIRSITTRWLAITISAVFGIILLVQSGSALGEVGIPLVPKPTISVRATAGDLDVEEGVSGSTLGVAAQVRFGRLGLFAEAAKTRYEDEIRVDRQLGLGVTLNLLSMSGLQTFLRASTGINRVSRHSETVGDQLYGAIGAGFSYEVISHLSVTAEFLAGQRRIERRIPHDQIMVPAAEDLADREDIAQARIGVAVAF